METITAARTAPHRPAGVACVESWGSMSVSFSQGQVIEGRYQLLSRLGSGGVGSVWLPKDHTLKITVSVKVLRSAVNKRTEMLALFEREAELSARMMSPNIVRVLAR